MNTKLIFSKLAIVLIALAVSQNVFAVAFSITKTITVGTSPLTAVITPNGSEVYIANYGSNTVTVIDTTTDLIKATVGVGVQPDALAVSPDGSKVYVGQHGGNVSVINTANKSVSTIATGGAVRDLAITPNGTKIYLAMEWQGLKKIQTINNSVSTVSTYTCPEGVTVTPNGQYLYVNYQCYGPGGVGSGHDAIGKFDVATDRYLKSVAGFPNVGTRISVSPDGVSLWAGGNNACSTSYNQVGCVVKNQGVVNVLRTDTDALVRTLGVGGRVAFFPRIPYLVLGGSQLLILDRSMGYVGQFDISASGSLAVTPNSTKAYVPVPGSNAVKVISITL